MEKKDNQVKIRLGSLVLMIFSSIFGFSNSLTAFYQMGYSSIIQYIVTAILFFLPSALIFAEYGAAFKGIKGGIFSWLEGSTNEKVAFIGIIFNPIIRGVGSDLLSNRNFLCCQGN